MRVDKKAQQKVSYRNEGVKILRGDLMYKLNWKSENLQQNGGVGSTVKFAKSVMDVRRISPRILSVDMALFGMVVTVISVHGPWSSKSEEGKERSYDDPSAKMQSKSGNRIVLVDINRHVESSIDGYEGILGVYGWGIRNKDDERHLEFASSFDMVVECGGEMIR